jgi:hypothetical protein
MYHKDYKKSSLNKKSISELHQECQRLFIQSEKSTKSSYVKSLTEHYEKNCLHPYKVLKVKCNDYDLIRLGQQIKVQGQEIFPGDLSLVLIENQISPIANRMKTIQGMLAQYFIMDYANIDIKFISSQNKLKYFYKRIDATSSTSNTTDTGNRYNDNKKNGIKYCKELLGRYKQNIWMSVLETPKKDDLADAFLQGVWYIENNIFSA